MAAPLTTAVRQEKEDWLQAPREPAEGEGFRLSVTSAMIGGPFKLRKDSVLDVQDSVRDAPSHKDMVVRLRLENLSRNRILAYPDWGRFDGFLSGAGLKDNLGNTYRWANYGTWKLAERAPDSRVRPGRDSTDILVFEEPLPQATEFFLELPRPEYSITHPQVFRFRFPRVEVGDR
jgi:hypothetical protein